MTVQRIQNPVSALVSKRKKKTGKMDEAIKESQTEVGYTDAESAARVEPKKRKIGNARSRRPVGRFGRPDMFLIRTHRERSIQHTFARK